MKSSKVLMCKCKLNGSLCTLKNVFSLKELKYLLLTWMKRARKVEYLSKKGKCALIEVALR